MIRKSLLLAALTALPMFASLPATAADLDEDYSTVRYQDTRVQRDYDFERRQGHWNQHRPYRGIVAARGSYAGEYLPYHMTEWHARRSAIEAWRMKVDGMYGPRFAKWRDASNKSIDCERIGRSSVECTVSARPERGEGRNRWGSWNWRRTYE
jgi:hypothetical protein